MSQLELTIGIPTYNGDRYLAESIDSVLRQLPDVPGRKIEILISDNASTDNTRSIIKQYKDDYPDIVNYTSNPQNIGYDLNVDRLFKVANGEYLWLLGDDDVLAPNAISRFFSVIDKYKEISIFLFSVSILDINTGKKQFNNLFNEDILCSGGDEFLQRSLWASSALSSLCVRKDDWNSENIDKYMWSMWVHIGGVIEIMRHQREAYIFADEMVVVRENNPRWGINFGNQLEIGLKHLAVFESAMSRGYDKQTFKCFSASRYAENLKSILLRKPSGLENKFVVAKLMIHFFKHKPGLWLLHLPLLFTPNVVSSVAVNFIRRTKRAA